MVKTTYTQKQRKTLLKNKNVIKVGKGVITYSKDFKIKAAMQYQKEYMTPQEIFIQADFDLNVIGRKKPTDCLEKWGKIYREKGLSGFNKIERRGRPKKPKDKSDKDRIERLEAENIYLKAENDFLVKLRAKRGY